MTRAGGGAGRNATSGGGDGGGGNGSGTSGSAGSGTANTGSGGGGTRGSALAGSGGSGVIIFSTDRSVSFSGGVTQTSSTVGSQTVYTVTAAGPTDTVTIGI